MVVGELAGGKKIDRWGFPKEQKRDYFRKSRDKQHNTSQENFSSGGGGLGHENRRDYRVNQPSDGSFGGTTISNSAFGFGGGPRSGGEFLNTNQYRYGGNGTGN